MAAIESKQEIDNAETQEWLRAFDDVIDADGVERAQFLLDALLAHAESKSGVRVTQRNTPYCNTLSPNEEKPMPPDDGLASRIQALIRWNAVAMVVRAGKTAAELGGHIATYASAATLYEVLFNHFLKGEDHPQGSDLLFAQGHSSPGIYARAYLEGRLQTSQLQRFRQEIGEPGLSSYPHPWLMPDFWQFPTVSMGLGPMQAIYQARFLKYLQNRGLQQTAQRKVWAFVGDGEMDEPESLGGISIAVRERLDNLIFVINCNLQRLDGPVRGNGKIIQELEAIFRGAGWHVIKVVWGGRWDPLLAQDNDGLLQKRMNECVDGDFQSYKARDGAYVRENFFGCYPELKARVAQMSDDDIWRLNRGGHDSQKVFAAYADAVAHQGAPVVILAKTVKGYGMGAAGEGQNITHQQKKMTIEQLRAFRDRFAIPISDADIDEVPFYRPSAESPEIRYLKKQRENLGGYLPKRRIDSSDKLAIPKLSDFAPLLADSGQREISTTMAFVRMLNILLKQPEMGPRIVPIVPDECRTFGMEGLFRQIGIYAPSGQLYTPVDHAQVMYYKESKNGQILEEGLNEAGAFCSWLAAATSYSTNDLPMVPFYIYYSMFGFQRIGDFAWAAGDMKAKGFLLGGTAGRTTLAGEGLQHQDGHSHIMAATIPNCIAYDPAYAYELAVIVQHGLERMYQQGDNVFYYLTVMNENYHHPAMPEGVEEGIIRGMYPLTTLPEKSKRRIRLLGCGAILREVIAAAAHLKNDFDVDAEVWSVTSFNELRREALAVQRDNQRQPSKKPEFSYVERCFEGVDYPVVAATDYMRLYADQIREFVPSRFVALGTDGFGRSDTRKQLRHFFEVDANHIAYTAVIALVDEGHLPKKAAKEAITKYQIDSEKKAPWLC